MRHRAAIARNLSSNKRKNVQDKSRTTGTLTGQTNAGRAPAPLNEVLSTSERALLQSRYNLLGSVGAAGPTFAGRRRSQSGNHRPEAVGHPREDDEIQILDMMQAQPPSRPSRSQSVDNYDLCSPSDVRVGEKISSNPNTGRKFSVKKGCLTNSKGISVPSKGLESGSRGQAGPGVEKVTIPHGNKTAAVAEWINSLLTFQGHETSLEKARAGTSSGRPTAQLVHGVEERTLNRPSTNQPRKVTEGKKKGPPGDNAACRDNSTLHAAHALPSPATSEIIIDDDNQDQANHTDVLWSEDKELPACQSVSNPSPGDKRGWRGLQDDPDEVSLISVKKTVAAVIRKCRDMLPAAESESVDRKLTKYVNSVAPQFLHSQQLDNFIESRLALLNSDQKNVYLQIRDILDELRRCRPDGRGGTTSELSDTGHNRQQQLVQATKKRAVLTTVALKVPLNVRADTRRESENMPSVNTASGPRDDRVDATDTASRTGPGAEGQAVMPTRGGEERSSSSLGAQPEHSRGGKEASQQHIRMLEKALEKCRKKIQELESAEVDFDKEDDETYVEEAK